MNNRGHLASIARNQNLAKGKSPMMMTPSAAAGMSRVKEIHTSVSAAMLPIAKTSDNSAKRG